MYLANGITLHLPATVKAGQEIPADATLLAGGVPVVGAGLHFVVDGSQNHLVVTDNTGTAHFKQRGNISAGSHRIDAFFGAAGASRTVVVTPVVLTVQAVPAVAGVTVTLDDGPSATSDSKGTMTLNVNTPGLHHVKTSLPPDDPKTRYVFTRWSDEALEPTRQLRIEQDLTVAVGLRIAYLTSIRFADIDGRPLDNARVSGVSLSGPNAEIMKLSAPYPAVWLQTAVPAKYTGEVGLHVTPAPYSVSTAYYDSLNVASRGGERYTPESAGTWTVKLLLFRLTLHARDAILGSSLSKPVTLTHPSGRKQRLQLNGDGDATLTLGRGNYMAYVHSPGVSPLAPIALSKSQTAVIPVITPIDLVIIVFTVLLVLLGVFALGRGKPLVRLSMKGVRQRMDERFGWMSRTVGQVAASREPLSDATNSRVGDQQA